MRRKIFVFTLCLSIIVSGTLAAFGGEGKGSVGDAIEDSEVKAPIEISNWHDLDAVRDNPGSDYVLVNDLDRTTEGYQDHASQDANGGNGWPPIGDESNPFTGTFDGQGHTITGLNIDRPDGKIGGLFAGISGGTIIDLGLEDVDINIGTFDQYENSGAGGLVGGANAASKIERCYVTGTVEGVSQVGGILGAGENYEIRNCYSDVTVSGNESYIGGIVGVHGQDTVLEYSYFINDVSGNNSVGALEGYNRSSAEVTNSYYNTDHTDAGGLGEGRTTDEMTWEYVNTYDGWDFVDTWADGDHATVIDRERNYGYPELEWQDEQIAPVSAISNWEELDAVRYDLSMDYELMNDLDEDTYGYKEYVNTTDGWEPIGDSSNFLEGSFDGKGNTISGLTINRQDESGIGLFHGLGEGEIKNVEMVDVDIKGNESIGGLVGVILGSVDNSSASGNVCGDWVVGGLVGLSWGGSVSNSYASGDVSGNDSIGGLVGVNGGPVKNSYAKGDMSGNNGIGGLVGLNDGPVNNSYSTGSVSGNDIVGGLVGNNSDTVENSYAIGAVSGNNDDVGGLVGYNDEGTVENSYANEDTTGQTVLIGEQIGTMTGSGMRTTTEMTYEHTETKDTFYDYNETIWDLGNHATVIDREGNWGYPALEWQEWVEPTSNFSVNVDDITAGEQPLIDILGAEHGDGTPVEGELEVEMTVDEENETKNLTLSSGEANHTWDKIKKAGNYTANVTIDGVKRSNNFSVKPADAFQLSFEQKPTNTTAGETIDPAVTVRIEDQYGNLVGDATDEVTLSIKSGSGTLYGNTDVSAVDGVAEFDDLYIEEADNYTLLAESGTLDSNISNQFSISPADEHELIYTAEPDNTTAGAEANFTVQRLDEFGNKVTDGTLTVTLDTTSEEGEFREISEDSAVSSVEITDGSSTTDFYYYDENAGDHNLTANATDIKPAVTTLTVDPASEHELVYVEAPDNMTAGAEAMFTVQRLDEFGNEVTDGTLTVTLDTTSEEGEFREISEGSEVSSVEITDGSSTTDIYYYDENAGDHDLTADANNVNPAVTTVTVEIGSGDNVNIDPNTTQELEAGGTIYFNASAYDEYGNLITDTDLDFDWNGTNENGTFYEEEVDNYYVQAHSDDLSSIEVEVEVIPAEPDHIVVSPREENIFAGENISYTATAYDGFENEIGKVTDDTTWYIEEGAGGEWDGNLYTSELAGTWNVTGTYIHEGEALMGNATLIVEPTDVDRILIEPEDETIVAGASVTYSATAFDEFRNEVGDVTEDVGWDIDDDAGGEWADNEYTSEIAGNWTVTATYTHDEEDIIDETTLTVEPEGYTLTIAIEGEGSTEPEEGNHSYEEGEEVNITATPAEGWYFVEWTGDETGTDPTITITMDEDKEITAHFEEIQDHLLRIDIEGEGITDPGEGTHSYEEGEEVTVNATPAEGWYFVEWTGDHNGTDEEFTFVMDENKSITANFQEEVAYHNLSIETVGEGKVEVDPEQEEYKNGTEVRLMVDPAEGWYFVEWTGDHEGTVGDVNITMDEDKEITAHFEEIQDHLLRIDIEGEGTTDPSEGTHTYEDGEEVTVTVTPDEGWYFKEWTGDYEGTDEEITLTMNEDQNITAWFEESKPEFEITDFSVDPTEGEPPLEVDITAEVENVGGTEGTITLKTDGEELESWTLAPGDTASVNETYTYNEEGLYYVDLGQESISVEVGDVVTYTLEVMTEGEGTVDIEPDRELYEEGAEVTLTADPNERWEFVEWTGDENGTKEEINISMDSDKEITAHFEEGEAEAIFEVEIINFDEKVEIGDEIKVIYWINNTGDAEGTQEITFRVRGVNIEVVEVTLGPGEEDTGNFTIEAEKSRFGDGGESEFKVISDDDEATVNIDVEAASDTSDENGFLANYWWLLFIIVAVVGAILLILLISRREESTEITESTESRDESEPPQQEPDYGFDQGVGETTSVYAGAQGISRALKDLGQTTKSRAYEYMTKEKGMQMEYDEFERELERLVREEKVILRPQKEGEDLYEWRQE